jgi:hypothetical protein
MGVRAKLTVTVELDAGSSWDVNCSANQIYTQASREGLAKLANALHEANVNATVELVKVQAVLVDLNPK